MKEEVACWLVGWLRTGRGGGGDRPVGRSDRLYHLSCNYRHKMPEDFRPLLSLFLPHPHNPPSRGLLDRLPSSPFPSGFLSAPVVLLCLHLALSLSFSVSVLSDRLPLSSSLLLPPSVGVGSRSLVSFSPPPSRKFSIPFM